MYSLTIIYTNKLAFFATSCFNVCTIYKFTYLSDNFHEIQVSSPASYFRIYC